MTKVDSTALVLYSTEFWNLRYQQKFCGRRKRQSQGRVGAVGYLDLVSSHIREKCAGAASAAGAIARPTGGPVPLPRPPADCRSERRGGGWATVDHPLGRWLQQDGVVVTAIVIFTDADNLVFCAAAADFSRRRARAVQAAETILLGVLAQRCEGRRAERRVAQQFARTHGRFCPRRSRWRCSGRRRWCGSRRGAVAEAKLGVHDIFAIGSAQRFAIHGKHLAAQFSPDARVKLLPAYFAQKCYEMARRRILAEIGIRGADVGPCDTLVALNYQDLVSKELQIRPITPGNQSR